MPSPSRLLNQKGGVGKTRLAFTSPPPLPPGKPRPAGPMRTRKAPRSTGQPSVKTEPCFPSWAFRRKTCTASWRR